MILYPAIDIYQGQAVRLRQGSFDDKTVYEEDPQAAAENWIDQGAKALHVVDLDGAKQGELVNLEHLRRIASSSGVPVQFGGGLRTIEAIDQVLEAGAARAILGTAALTDIDLLDDALAKYPDRVAVALDTKSGKLATEGWVTTSEVSVLEVIRRFSDRGVNTFIYTNIDLDGMLVGPNIDEVKEVAEQVRGKFIYSGGIGSLDDLKQLNDMRQVNLTGVIVGKALYEQRFTVAEALTTLRS